MRKALPDELLNIESLAELEAYLGNCDDDNTDWLSGVDWSTELKEDEVDSGFVDRVVGTTIRRIRNEEDAISTAAWIDRGTTVANLLRELEVKRMLRGEPAQEFTERRE